jgi:hypothetical protein
MAEKISVEIALDGGAEVVSQLTDIGKAGQKAFGDIQGAAEQIDLTSATAEFQDIGNAGVDAFNKIQQAAQTATIFEGILQGVKRVEGAFESLGTAATKLGARLTRSLGPLGVVARALGPMGIAAGVAGGALIKFGDDAADAINKLTAQGAKIGLTAQQFDVLQKALTQAGIAPDAILPGLEKLRESFGGNIVPALQAFIAQLEQMPDSVQRTQLAIQVLGDALGAQVIGGLQAGTLSSKNFAAALGAITPVTQEQIAQAAKYQAALNQMSAAWNQVKAAISPIVTPVFQVLTAELNNLSADLRRLGQELQLVKAIFDLFTAPMDKQAAAAQRVRDLWNQLGQTAQQTSQQMAQSGVLVQDPWTGLPTTLDRVTQGFAQTGQNAAQAGAQGAQAGQQIATGMDTANQSIGQTNSSLAGIDWSGWANSALSAIQSIINKLLELIGLRQRAGGTPLPDGKPIGAGGIGSQARGGLIGGRGTGTSDSNLAWVSRGEHIMPARVVRQPGVLAFLEALRRSGHIPGFAAGGIVGGGGTTKITLAVSEIHKAIEKNTEAINSQSDVIMELGRIVAGLAQTISSLMTSQRQMAQSQQQMAKSQQGYYDAVPPREFERLISEQLRLKEAWERRPALAYGGLIGGRGTGTSDSNLAWLSRGEHIMPAWAVRQPGVLAFLEALRRSGGNLSRVLDGMGRFALGGLVPRSAMAFAGGGTVGMSNVTIQFPGVPPVGGLRASSAVVDELRKTATLAQVRSGGRKPSRYS